MIKKLQRYNNKTCVKLQNRLVEWPLSGFSSSDAALQTRLNKALRNERLLPIL